MATSIDKEESLRRQRLAIFYARRARYQKVFRELGLTPIYDEIRAIEKELSFKFDNKKFYDEVKHPEKCVIIEGLIKDI